MNNTIKWILVGVLVFEFFIGFENTYQTVKTEIWPAEQESLLPFDHPLNTSYPIDRSNMDQQITASSYNVSGELHTRIEFPPRLYLDTLKLPKIKVVVFEKPNGDLIVVDMYNGGSKLMKKKDIKGDFKIVSSPEK